MGITLKKLKNPLDNNPFDNTSSDIPTFPELPITRSDYSNNVPEYRLNYFNEAWDYTNEYYKSPGFEQRYRNHYATLPEGTIPKYEDLPDLPEYMKLNYTPYSYGSYDPRSNKIELGDRDRMNIATALIGANSASDIDVHELRHFLDNLMSGNILLGRNRPTARNYQSTYDVIKNKTFMEEHPEVDVDSTPTDAGFNSVNYSVYHDYYTDELASDVEALRFIAKKFNIRDSTKADNFFTEDDINKLKKIVPDFRLFKNNPTDLILLMLNTFAYNSQNTQDLYYAKHGLKLIPRKQYIK